MKKNKRNRFLSILLSFVLVLSLMSGMSLTAWAEGTTVTWDSSNAEDLYVLNSSQTIDGITIESHSSSIEAYWGDFPDGIYFDIYVTGGFTFTNTLGGYFTKIEITTYDDPDSDWYNYANSLGSGWSFSSGKATWTGNAASVDLLAAVDDFLGVASSIVFTVASAGKSVNLTGGANATASGSTSQTVSGAMETVTYTATAGYQFPLFDDITNNGVTATRTDNTTVTVSGTPNADVNITIPDAVLTSLPDGAYAQTAKVGGVDYTRYVYVLPLSALDGKKKATFTVTKGSASKDFETDTYYTGVTSSGITYVPASEGSVMLVCTVKGAKPEDLTCTLKIDGVEYSGNSST